MMERYLIRYFLAVVDHGNFSRAAAECNVSQPTLSVGIAKLEEGLRTRLFVRTNQRVQLTEAGTRFLAHARRIEREFNLAQAAMDGSAPRPILRLGVLSSIPGALVADAVAAARQEASAVEILFGTERDLVSQLARGRLDLCLGLTARGGERFEEDTLAQEGYRVVAPARHRLAARGQVAAEELAGDVMSVRRHCEVLSDTSRFFLERGVRPHFALRSTNDERVVQMVCAGLGVTVMPECYRAEGMAQLRMTGFDLVRAVGYQFAHGAEHWRVERHALLDALRERLAQAAG
ncbi:MAG TPA: LysR family transcriptional regulator [Novosphingobium sp.]|nr:LysR family transcriptional regulator [Novosphingobium sp.]